MPKYNASRIESLSQSAVDLFGLDEVAPVPFSIESDPPFGPRLISLSPGAITLRSPLETRPPFDPNRDPEDLELLRSVKDHGVVQPVVVYRIEDESGEEARYGLISGHRRLDAAGFAQLETIPALLVPAQTDPRDRDLLTALENLQRKDLTPLEKARQIQLLVSRYGFTQRDAADFIGHSESHVSSLLHLLDTPPVVQAALATGKLGVRYAREAESLPSPQLGQVLGLVEQGMAFPAALEAVAGQSQLEDAGLVEGPVQDPAEGERLSREIAAWEKEADPEPVELHPGRNPDAPRPAKHPAQDKHSGALRRLLGEKLAGEFQSAIEERSLESLVPEKEVLFLALLWLENSQDLAQALSVYRELTRPVRREFEKALLAIDRLSLLAVGSPSRAGSRAQIGRFLGRALASWFDLAGRARS